jgi:hypothetical protein
MPVMAPSVQPIPAPMPIISPPPIIPKALQKTLPRQDARPVKASVARLVVPPPKPAGLLEDPLPPVQQVQLPTVPAQPAQAPPAAASPTSPLLQSGEHKSSDTITRSQRKPVTYYKLHTVHPPRISTSKTSISTSLLYQTCGMDKDITFWLCHSGV